MEVNKLDSVLSKAVIDDGSACELTVVIQSFNILSRIFVNWTEQSHHHTFTAAHYG